MNQFEEELSRSLEYYENRGELLGERIVEKRRFLAKVSYGTSRYDFFALRYGKYYGIEAKSCTKAKRFPLKNLGERQRYELLNVVQNGGMGIVAIRFMIENERSCFFAHIQEVVKHKSITLDECIESKLWIQSFYKNYKYDIPKVLDKLNSIYQGETYVS